MNMEYQQCECQNILDFSLVYIYMLINLKKCSEESFIRRMYLYIILYIRLYTNPK